MRGEFVDIGGQRLYYYAAGTRGSGLAVVLLHGFPLSSRLWHLVVRDFPAEHRLVVCDLPGYGRSDLPRGGAASCATHATAVLALLDDLRIASAAIVGHGLGGGVAQALALMAPERVSHLALVSSAAFGERPRRLARLPRRMGALAPRTPPSLLAGLVHGSARLGFANADRSRLTLDGCLQAFTTTAGREALVAHLHALDHCDTVEWSPRLGELDIPSAVIWGREDPFLPVALGERLARELRHAELTVIDGARHYVPEDSPDQLVRALEPLLLR
ncbi:MAG: alpha/beta fold hydrolase [Gemmatimonadaceae bacterium]